jgi:serine/threonine-protein kinase PRP4
VGDVLDGRFKIVSAYGRGVFSSVVKCIELDPAATAAAAAAAGGGDGASAADGGADGADGDEPICLSSVAAPGRVWAVKILRNNEMMRRAGEKEASILARLRAADPDDKQHVISFRGSFEHEGHLCLAFEAMHQNLRQAVRQHGHRRGIQIDAVRTYARHLLTALRLLARVDVIHADLKPDNIVVNDKYSTLKVRARQFEAGEMAGAGGGRRGR